MSRYGGAPGAPTLPGGVYRPMMDNTRPVIPGKLPAPGGAGPGALPPGSAEQGPRPGFNPFAGGQFVPPGFQNGLPPGRQGGMPAGAQAQFGGGAPGALTPAVMPPAGQTPPAVLPPQAQAALPVLPQQAMGAGLPGARPIAPQTPPIDPAMARVAALRAGAR